MTPIKIPLTTTFIARTEDHFAMNTEDGGVRVGIIGGCCVQIPPGHAMHAGAAALTDAALSDYIDGLIETGYIPLAAL
ncbi:MAG: hypothetical protein AB9M53_00680 [Leptothrix sp. (in: b-proteobacteria)]